MTKHDAVNEAAGVFQFVVDLAARRVTLLTNAAGDDMQFRDSQLSRTLAMDTIRRLEREICELRNDQYLRDLLDCPADDVEGAAI